MRSAQFTIRNSPRYTTLGLSVLRIAYCPVRGEWSSAMCAGSTGDWGLATGDIL